jgi:hypothetical protein
MKKLRSRVVETVNNPDFGIIKAIVVTVENPLVWIFHQFPYERQYPQH